MRNKFISDNLDFIEDSYNETQKTAKDRVDWIRNYIENLEQDSAEYLGYLMRMSAVVQDFNGDVL